MSGKHYNSILSEKAASLADSRYLLLEDVLSDTTSPEGDCLLVVYDFVNKRKICSRFI